MNDTCDILDKYIANQLDGNSAQRFEAHLADCDYCRDHVEANALLDQLFSQANPETVSGASLEQAKAFLVNQLRQHRMQALRWAAAAVVLIAGISVWANALLSHKDSMGDRLAGPASQPGNSTASEVQVELSTGYIAVPVESDSRDVSILMLYPAVSQQETDPSSESRWTTNTLLVRISP